ncbi:MAG: CotH kinase family protein [Kiritimatiellae bacterium]|nr:CotH kinase family protein [Kiritimatiellia bacterium]
MKRLLLAVLLASAGLHTFAAEYAFDYRNPQAWAGKPSLAVGDQVALTLAEDLAFTLRIVSAPPPGIAGQSFIANVEGAGASAILKATKKGLRVTIDDFEHSKLYTATYRDGEVKVKIDDTSSSGPEECGTCGESLELPAIETTDTTPVTAKRKLLATSGDAFQMAAQKSVVDILVAFDQGAKAWAENVSNWGGQTDDSIEEFADYAVGKMNTVLANSQLDDKFCYRLVGVIEIDGTWTAINNALLLSMRAREGAFAKLSQLRDKYGADTITLLVNRTSGTTSGIGFEYDEKYQYPSSFDGMNYACNVCDSNTVYSRYTMSHETGHNMGCGHSNRQGDNSGPGRFSYSCGYHFTDTSNVKRHTVMAYEYAGDGDNDKHIAIPYFSAPGISPTEYGCALGVEGINDNRQTLQMTHADIASLREHVLPYDWDVKFLDNDGNEIPDGTYYPSSCNVTFAHSNPDAKIYYTQDGTTPTSDSSHCSPGDKITVYLYSPKTITACAVTNSVAISTRSITLKGGLTWSGDENGYGVWASNDSSKTPWSGEHFGGDPVVFPDLADIACATVMVQDAVSPESVWFRACDTGYVFDKGSNAAQINVPDTAFAPAGDVTFNVPVKLEDAVAFTNQTGTALTFNAPFGQTIDSNGGSFAGKVNIGSYGTLTVAPGAGKTQTLEKLNNDNWYYATSTFRVGEGTVVFNGTINGGNGVTGRTKLEVGNGGSLIFNQGGGTGYDMDNTSLTVEKGGTVTFNDMELLKRTLYLNGGTIYVNRFDLMSNPGIYVTDDSAIEDNTEGYIYLRGSDSEINVSDGKTLIFGIRTDNRTDTAGNGIVKKGGGTLVANKELKHSGVTKVDSGTIEVGYSSGSTVYGQGWTVASNSTLRVKSGCSLKVPSLTLDPTSIISLPAATSAPLVVNGNVDLTEVKLSIQDIGDLSLGASYPLISATGEISGLKDFIRQDWPRPADGLGWKVAVLDGVLTASIVDIADADPYIDFTTNISGLRPTIPEDATMSSAGGLQIGSSPIVIDGLTTNAVGVTLDVTIGEPTAAERTICSWVVDGNIARCVVTNGVLDCFHGTDGHVKNDVDFLTLSPGRHVINVGYKSLNDTTYGGTFVYVDGTLAYRAAGLRWSDKSVSKFTVGATAADTPDKQPYTGLVVHNFALMNESSSDPLPNMTSSGGTVEYDYFAGKPPCVFALTPDGAFETYGAILSGAFSGQYDALSVSIVASFPANATGTIVSSAVLDGYYGYSTQVEYRGNGVLAFRDNGNGSLIASVQVSADMSTEHLYTLTYTNGTGYKLYLDGTEVLSNEDHYKGNNMPIINRVVFGCGYWTNWMTSYNDNPNPISNLKVYASHIALGTDDRTVSETPVKEATGYDSEEPDPEPPATPAVVDVLVAYDNGAYNYVTSRSRTLEEFAQTQIERMNKVLVTNKLDRFYSYRLVGVCRVNEGYSDINNVATLVAEGEGPCASLRAAREMCGADTVTLLVNTSGSTLGNSLQIDYRDDVPGQHDCAYSVCSIAWVDSNEQYTMLHENAHTMGCGHARAQYTEDDLAQDPDKYSYGYYFTDENSVNRHTIMAYGNNASPYFSTTSSEFGYKLGDSTNNNARVLKETCADVSRWRDNVKPLGDVVAATDEDGNEVFSGRLFKDTLKVTITAPVENATLYYTFDGTDPTLSNYFSTQPSPFTFNFNVTSNLKVAYYDGDKLSPVRTVKVTKCDNIPGEGVWQTSLKFPWAVEGDTIRSYNHTDYSAKNKNCTTPLSATIEGPKVLSFKHKSYFFGSDLGSNYSHFEVLLDDSIVLSANNYNLEWSDDVKVSIPAGKHTVQFVYLQRNAMNDSSDYKDGDPKANDAVWLKDIVLSDPEEPESADPCDTFFEWTPGSAPTGWFTEWGGEDQGGTHNVVAPDGSMQDLYVTYYDGDSNSQKWIPWESNANPESLDNYTFMVYGNIDDVNPSTGKLAVLWDMGFNGKQNTILAKDAAGNVKLIQANSNVIKRCINAGQVEGYHLFTVRFSTTSGASLQIDDGVIYSDSTFTQVSDKGFQVGSVLGGLPASFDRGTGFVVVKMLAFDTDSIPASQYRQLCEEYPAVTNRVLATVGETEYYRLQYLLDDLSSNSLTFTATDEMVVDVNGQTISAAISGEEFSLADNGLLVAATGENTYIIGRKAESAVLRISEIMPKPTDAQNHGALEGMDVNGLESGWVEVENTSPDKWANLADYKFIRSNRGKKTGQADYGNFPSVLIAPHGRAIFYTSERYSNSADMSVSAWATPDEGGVKPKIYTDLGNILVWPDKVNPKKSPFVRLTYTPSNTIVDTVIIPSDVPEGYSIIVGETKPGEATQRWLCPTPTRGTVNTDAGLVKIGPNVGPLYELTTGKKHDSASEFARPVPTAQPGEDYEIVFSLNPVMSPTVAGGFRDEDAIASITLVYRTDLDDTTLDSVPVRLSTDVNDTKDWGHTYKAYIPADALPAAGHLVQWKFEITDASGNNWTSPSFNNKDDGYEWYGTIVEPDPETQMSATLPTWHMFADSESLEQMDVDASDQTLANNARVAIYDSSTSNYYDYVRIDLRGNTSAKFTKKSHGLRFAKAHPLTMTDVVTGEQIEEIRKTSLISEFADPSYMRQMMAFWLWRKMGNLVPFDFPVRCNLNGEFYQLAFNSERFTDELIEDVYGLDKFGYGYKNVGTLKSGSGTTAGGIEKKTPDDEDESNITVLQNELRAKITAAQDVSSSPDGGDKGLNNADLTKFVVQKFNLPAWLNYLASARITQEMDDVWANVCAYYDNAEMKEGVRGTGTWMPLGYDFNLSFGQYYYNDIKDYGNNREGLMSNQDWFKSHPFYGGNRVKAYRNSNMVGEMNGNDGFESVLQSSKFRRLFLRRLRTLMDQELKEPSTEEEDTPFMAKMREMADLMRADAADDTSKWGNDTSDNSIDVWTKRPADMDAGINDIWEHYVVPRREHLYVTHSATNTTKTIGYGSNLNAGIPEAQSPIETLAPNIYVSNLTPLDTEQAEALGVAGQFYDTKVIVIRNDNDEVVDMSGWRLAFSVDFTFPAGTVCDANDSIYIVADRRTYIEAHNTELTDQVIVGNATFTGAGPIALYDADGTLVYSAIPQTNELKYLRLHSFYGNTLDGGDAGEWFTLTNISDAVTLDLADVTVCFLKQGDDHDTTGHCHVTLTNKKGKGDVKPLKSWTAQQLDYSDKGWLKIQNNKQQITIYDKYGSVCQSLMVEQKKFPLAYGNGGYLVCDSTDASVTKNSQWHAALYELANDGELSEPFSAEDQEVANELVATAKPVLSEEDIAAGLNEQFLQYLTIVAEPVEGSSGQYKAVVDVNPATVEKPAVDTSSAEPMEIEDDTEDPDKKQVSVSISNATPGLWYGYEVSTSLGDDQNFQNDIGSFKRATSAAHKVTGSPRDKTETSAFFRVKVLPAKPTE